MFDPRWDDDPRERDDQSRDLSRGSRGCSDPRERERTDPRDVFMDLHHCVASYADRCWRGASRIWSLRVHRGEKVRHVLTIEVDIKRRAVVQARGWGNRVASEKLLRLLQDWTARERLRLAI